MLLVDTGPLLAVADRSDPDHERCREVLESDQGPLLTSPMVIAEAGYLICRQLGPVAEARLYESLAASELLIEHLAESDWTRVRQLVTDYADLPLGGTDASLIALAERLGLTRIATLDRRHFTVVRPRHCEAFELVPAP